MGELDVADELWAGRYRRDRLLGRGAMGEVWAAYDVVLDRHVAIKSISAARTDPDDLARMAREARVAARITHQNAVAVHDLLTVDDRPNLVLEYVDGDTLAELIARNGRLDPARVAFVGASVADALAEAHRLGVVHRDIKPANILITPRGVPKLADFGIARIAGDANMTATGMMIGTPAYLAPEIVSGAPADARSDVWSLGVTLYTALEGGSPFTVRPDDEPFVVLGRVLHAPIRPPSCGGRLAQAVMTMLDRDPARRPTATEAAVLLRDTSSPMGNNETTRLARPIPPPAPTHPVGPPPASVAAPGEAWSTATQSDPDLLPGTWTSGEYRQPDARRPRRGGIAVLAAGLVVVLLAAGLGAYVVLDRHGSNPVAAGSSSPITPTRSSTPATTKSATTPSTPSGDSSAPGPSDSPTGSPTPAAGETAYSGPGGITAIAPDDWTRDAGSGNNNVIDYDAPGSDGFVHGQAFQLGIGNPHALPTIQDEARGAKRYLRSVEKGMSFPQTSYTTYLDSPAVTIEYTGTNSAGVARHGIERLWVSGGVTREVIVSGRSDQWTSTLPVFTRLVDTCRVS